MTATAPLFGTLAATGVTIALVHAALPTHWLPFVLAGRRQHWSRAKTLAVTAVAGTGHTLFTIALGVLVLWLGITLDRWTVGVFPYVAAAILFGLGLVFVLRRGHGHVHFGGGHAHLPVTETAPLAPVRPLDPARPVTFRSGDRAVIGGLVMALTLSPCEGFLPMFIAGGQFGWPGFAALAAILAVVTVGAMVSLTALTLLGVHHLPLAHWERYENKIVGGVLILLGVAILIWET